MAPSKILRYYEYIKQKLNKKEDMKKESSSKAQIIIVILLIINLIWSALITWREYRFNEMYNRFTERTTSQYGDVEKRLGCLEGHKDLCQAVDSAKSQ